MAYNKELFVDMSQPSSYEELAAMHLDKRPVKGIVQPPVKPSENKSRRNTNLLQFMLYVVSTMCKHPDSWPFRKPVDTLHLKIPDYRTIIKYPMDLYTIRRRIQNFYYYDVNECIKDFRLVFYNCYLYNRPDTEVVSMAKKIEEIFVETMVKCTEKEVEIPIPIKPSKSNGKGRKKKDAVSGKTETYASETLTTSASFPVEGNSKPNQSTLSVFESTSQVNNTSQLWTCPECGYHSEKLQDFWQKPSVDKRSMIQTRLQSAQSSKTHVCECSSSGSSSSSNDFEEKIEELKERVKRLTETLEYLIKEFNDNRKRKQDRRNKRKLRNELSYAAAATQKIVHVNGSSLVTASTHSVSVSTSLNNTLNKLQNPKQTKKNSSKCICAPKPAAGTKKGALKRVCPPKPAAQTKKRKTNCNPPQKQRMLPAPACLPPPPVSTAKPNNSYRMKMKNAGLKPMSFEEKRKLGKELLKLDVNATTAVTTIIKLMEPSLYDPASNEMELDIDALKLTTLRKLQKYVANLKKETESSGSIDKNDSKRNNQIASNKREREKDADDDTSSTTSTSSSNDTSSSSSSSNSEPCLYYSDDSSSSSNTSNDGERNSTANRQSTVMTNAATAPHPDSTTSPVKVDKIVVQQDTASHFPNLPQVFIKSEPYDPYLEECKLSFPGSSQTSRSVSQLNNYVGASHGPPKEITNRTKTINTHDMDLQNGYTRITKRVEQAEKKAQFDPDNQRLMDNVENAKKTMRMRENAKKQVQNLADQPGKGGVKIKKEVYKRQM